MSSRKAKAVWHGTGKDGTGEITTSSGVLSRSPYGFNTRFENGPGTNPEELIAAAHAGCFSMALSAALTEKGHPPTKIHTSAKVHFGPVPGGIALSKVELATEGSVPGIDAATFEEIAMDAKKNCPISKALAALEITLTTKFV
jgi:osmotically inducible protein OsmC